jgi:hypothetical protein
MKKLLLVAQYICRSRHATANDPCATTAAAIPDDELRACVLELCKMLTGQYSRFNYGHWRVTEGEVDESSLDFRRHLASAAAWMGDKSLVVKMVGAGCEWYNDG